MKQTVITFEPFKKMKAGTQDFLHPGTKYIVDVVKTTLLQAKRSNNISVMFDSEVGHFLYHKELSPINGMVKSETISSKFQLGDIVKVNRETSVPFRVYDIRWSKNRFEYRDAYSVARKINNFEEEYCLENAPEESIIKHSKQIENWDNLYEVYLHDQMPSKKFNHPVLEYAT